LGLPIITNGLELRLQAVFSFWDSKGFRFFMVPQSHQTPPEGANV